METPRIPKERIRLCGKNKVLQLSGAIGVIRENNDINNAASTGQSATRYQNKACKDADGHFLDAYGGISIGI